MRDVSSIGVLALAAMLCGTMPVKKGHAPPDLKYFNQPK
jgi:hypothetical protein